jgi:acetyl esterase/lipase
MTIDRRGWLKTVAVGAGLLATGAHVPVQAETPPPAPPAPPAPPLERPRVIIYVPGGMFHVDDPRQREALARAVANAVHRNVTIRRA